MYTQLIFKYITLFIIYIFIYNFVHSHNTSVVQYVQIIDCKNTINKENYKGRLSYRFNGRKKVSLARTTKTPIASAAVHHIFTVVCCSTTSVTRTTTVS